MTELLEQIADRARRQPRRIVMSEGEDPRIVEGALRAARDGISRPVLVGKASEIADRLAEAGARPDEIEIADPAASPMSHTYAAAYHELRKAKGVDEAAAARAVREALVFAAMMVRQGDADGTIGGAVHTTADTVRAALQIIGRGPGVKTVSSFFLMSLREPEARTVIFADCGLIMQPTDAELAEIAIASAASLRALTGQDASIAMLSFSTMGSVPVEAHESIGRIRRAVEMIRERAPDLTVDGEIQFDAAIVPAIASKKAPGSPLKGQANIFVFPSLSAGNIGYKIAQRVGGARAIGPILQGLLRPANDLSRGCSAEDVFSLIAVTGLQAADAGDGNC